ncbi:MAG: metallophosphoesterase [Phycisphaerae bacterium]|nr:metallophosphoesterase [Phycisphaerae bacterium]
MTSRNFTAGLSASLAALIAACVPGVGSSARARQPVERDGGGRRDGLIAQMTAFKTDVPARAIDVVLARPTGRSITVSVVCYEPEAREGYVEYRREDAAPISKTEVRPLPTGSPVLFSLDGLSPDTAYVYRVRYGTATTTVRGTGDAPMTPVAPAEFKSTEYSTFHTPRASGKDGGFTFTIQADSHLDQGVEPKVYERTLANMLPPVAPARPDFVIDLGDTFMTDKRGAEFTRALPQYDAQRYYLGLVARTAPLYMVLGNHDGEKGTSGRAADDIGPWSYAQRTSRFPPPIIDGAMYTGSTGMRDGIGSNYYAFQWGDALCVVLDPYWSTTDRVRGGGGRAGAPGAGGGAQPRPGDDPLEPTDASWGMTLGREQYDWLARTLSTTTAKYRFVFIHHLVGGVGGAEARGGAESSVYFEWGGRNADGSAGFAARRPGWPMPVHDLLVRYGVSAVFHGHDHLYVHSVRDGVHYQCVPQPGNPAGNTRTAARYGYGSGVLHGSPGHVRVRVDDSATTVEFVRTAVEGLAPVEPRDARRRDRPAPVGAAVNGAVVDSYTISPSGERR